VLVASLAIALLASLGAASRAQAHELADELTVGELSAGSLRTAYIADQLEGVLELSDQWFISAAAGLTHLAPTSTLHTADIPHYLLGLGFESNDQLEINLAVSYSPTSSLLENSGDVSEPWLLRLDSRSLGLLLTAAYATGQKRDLEAKVEGEVGISHYDSERAQYYDITGALPTSANASSSLTQGHLALTVTTSLFRHTDIAASGAYYGYLGNYQQSDGQNIILANGLPLEPLRDALRATITEHLGKLAIGGHIQHADYVSDLGGSWSGGVKGELPIVEAIELSLSAEYQHAVFADGTRWSVLGVSLGASYAF
jgi:hypothetical protein